MSDLGRKDFSSKVDETVTPDSHKSTTQKTKEIVTGKADHVAGSAQPTHDKSIPQSVADTTSTHTDTSAPHTHDRSVMDKVKDTVGMDTSKHT